MKVINLNLRGIGNRVKGRLIKNLLDQVKVDLVCFQEVKTQNFNNRLIKKLWGEDNFDWAFSPAINRSGGILCI